MTTPTDPPRAEPARRAASTFARRARRLWAVLLLGWFAAWAAPAAAQTSGLWTTAAGDHLLLLQDGQSGATFAIQVPSTLSAMRVWLGSGSTTALSLQSLAQPADLLVANVAGSTMSGSMTLGGVTQPFAAELALAWVATEYAGVWQKAAPANAYMVFCVLNNGAARIGVQVDVTILADKSLAWDVFTGALVGTTFNGASIAGTGLLTRLDFAGATLTGQYTTLGRPPQVTPFSATQIVKIAP